MKENKNLIFSNIIYHKSLTSSFHLSLNNHFYHLHSLNQYHDSLDSRKLDHKTKNQSTPMNHKKFFSRNDQQSTYRHPSYEQYHNNPHNPTQHKFYYPLVNLENWYNVYEWCQKWKLNCLWVERQIIGGQPSLFQVNICLIYTWLVLTFFFQRFCYFLDWHSIYLYLLVSSSVH